MENINCCERLTWIDVVEDCDFKEKQIHELVKVVMLLQIDTNFMYFK